VYHVGLGEVLWSQGVDHLANMMDNFINNIEDETKAPHIRDGFLMLFIYLPSIFKEKFTSFISKILPCILKVRLIVSLCMGITCCHYLAGTFR